jgi:hypothetical protein
MPRLKTLYLPKVIQQMFFSMYRYSIFDLSDDHDDTQATNSDAANKKYHQWTKPSSTTGQT